MRDRERSIQFSHQRHRNEKAAQEETGSNPVGGRDITGKLKK